MMKVIASALIAGFVFALFGFAAGVIARGIVDAIR